jgi:histidinol-phosphate aminotransferase
MLIERAGAVPRFLGPRADLRLPLDELEQEIERDPRRPVILCTPNNPTGDVATPAEVERLLMRLEAPLLLDNAYGEFCQHDYLSLLARHRHLLIFRTFSKAWSLAGFRLGYLLADPALVGELLKVKLPYNVGFAAAIAGEAVLAASAAAERRVRVVLGRRGQWRAMLEGLGFEVFPSQANFFLVRCPERPGVCEIQQGLEARGIRVRDVSGYPGLGRCLRFSVGSGRALRDARAALADILQEAL